MIKRVLKRFTAMLLAFVLLFTLFPNLSLTAYAATSGEVTGLSDTNIGLSYEHSGSATDSWAASGTTITGSVVAVSGTCGNTDYNSTLTITNNKTTAATLSFDYAVEVNSGTVQVDGAAVSSDGSYSYTKELAAGESIKVYLKSGSTTATKISMTNIALVSDVTATTTFQPAENGSYTVDGSTVTETYSSTQSSTQGYAVAATPASGYQFMGWYDVNNEKYISTLQSTTLNMEYDATITARFAPVGVALFDVGGQVFEDLDAATAYATSNSITKVTLVSDGTLTGSYTIPVGVVLLVPFDEAKTLYTDTPVALAGDGGTRKAYKTLTLAEGTSLIVNGGISVGGRYKSAGGSATGYMTGAYGQINMESGSRITVKSGGALYAWGFVTGNGNVTVESGGTVYEWFQIADFRGGRATMSMGNEVFPFSQYFVQNVEVPLILNAGAKEIVYTGVYASDKVHNASFTFVGGSGMFKVTSGSVTKTYDGATDRLRFVINGEMELNNLSLNLAGMNVNSADYVLPITNNISLEIASGKLTVNQTTALLAGVDVTVDQGAELLVSSGTSVYLYDQDEWTADNYVTGGKFKSVTYAPGKTYTRKENDLVDAKIDVNGTFTAAGAVYTTAGGADICSSAGTGVYQQNGTPGTETLTYQYTQSGSTVTSHQIAVTAAKLHNADGSYTETASAAAGDTINYVNGVWGGEPAATEYTVTFDANGGEGSMDAQTVPASTDTALTANTFTRTGYTFTGWNTDKDGNGTPYDNEATVNLTEDLTLYAQWQIWNGWYTDTIGTTYYVEGEQLYMGQWAIIDGSTYYFNEQGYIVKGLYKTTSQDGSHEATFVFDSSTGVFLSDKSGLHDVGADTYWIQNGEVVEYAGLIRIVKDDGVINYYYFGEDSKACKATAEKNQYLVEKTNGLALPDGINYTFGEDGVIAHFADTSINGIYFDESSSNYYYCIDGVIIANGLMLIDGSYYYARTSSGAFVCGQSYWITKTNGLLDEGIYQFDETGKIVFPEETETKNGIVEENGSLYYYENGVLTGAGLIQIGDDYYYVRTSTGEVVHGRTYWITVTNGLPVEAGQYQFADDGKMILPETEPEEPEDPEVKNGIVAEDGSLYYYVDGVRTGAGLIQIGDNYYYVRTSTGEVVHGRTYWITATNGLPVEAGQYQFADDGRMLIE